VICDEDVLRADVAVHQTHLGISRAIDEGLKYLLKIAMRDPRRHEVRLEADRMEDGIGRETLGDLGAPGGRRMDRGERGADLRSEGGACVALSQALLPYRQRQVLHGECACRIVGREDARRGAGRSFARGLEPEPLVTVALDRRFPDLRDTQARERALHAHVADLPDFRGLSAREVVRILTAMGLTARLHGSGVVAAQAPKPGSPIDPGTTCELWLERVPAAVEPLVAEH